MKRDAKIHSATDIAENLLDGNPMNVERSMHMKTHLLHGILDLRSSQSEVLESTNDRPIKSNIGSRRTIRDRKLGLRINKRSGGLAVKHAGALEELMSVLPLMKEEAIRTAHHHDTEEVVQRTQVLDGELSTKMSRELTEETSRTCRQDDVVDIEQQVGRVRALMIDEERGVRAGRAEPRLVEKRRDALVPNAWSLLESVKNILCTYRGEAPWSS